MLSDYPFCVQLSISCPIIHFVPDYPFPFRVLLSISCLIIHFVSDYPFCVQLSISYPIIHFMFHYFFLFNFPYPLTFHFYWIFHCKCTFTIFTLFPYWLALFLGFLFGEHTQKLRYRMVCNETQITTLWIRFPFLRPDYLDCFVEKESLAVKISKALLKEQQVITAQTPVSE